MNTLEEIIDEIKKHDEMHPDHGPGCACQDKHAGKIRRLIEEKKLSFKSLQNLHFVIGYVFR